MLKELTQVPADIWIPLLIAGVVLAGMVTRSWAKLRRAEIEHAFWVELAQHGYLAADLERLMRLARPARRGKVASPEKAGPAPPDSSLPATVPEGAGEEPSFGGWYNRRFAGIPVVIQVLLWLLYGYLWIPLWYAATRPRTKPAQAGSVRPGLVLAVFSGIALVFVALFGGIALLVYVASSSDSGRPREGQHLSPERWVVAVPAGGSGCCRLNVHRGYLCREGDVSLTAVVIAQSDPTAKLRVQTNPSQVRLSAPGPCCCAIELQSLGGTGDFTVQVSAVDPQQKRVDTTFTVQVRGAARVATGTETVAREAGRAVLALTTMAGLPPGGAGGAFVLGGALAECP